MRSSFLWVFLLGPIPAGAQDIFERARQEREKPSASGPIYAGRDRIDLQMSADLRSASFTENHGTGRVGVDAALDFDFACGKFDVGASLRSLFSKNAREEYLGSILGYIESELARNALVLACEASPTICQAFQHYRISAQSMLNANYDRCRAIQQGIDDSLEKHRAEALKACLEEKQRAGLPLDQALDECQNSDKIRSLTGERIKEIDLVLELSKALKLSDVEKINLESLLGNRVKYTTQGGAGEIAKDAVEQEYKRIRERYERNWHSAVDAVARGQAPPEAARSGLSPPGSPPVSPSELAELAIVRPSLRAVMIASIASQCALLELVRRVHEVERNLEAARKLPTANEVLVSKLEREITDLRAEIRRLTETHERQNELNRSLYQATAVARGNVAAYTTAALGQAVLDERRFKVDQETQKWGAGTRASAKGPKTASTGPGCGNCGPSSWGFGNAGGRK